MAWSLVALPALTAALLLTLARSGTLAGLVAVLGSLASAALAVVALADAGRGAASPFAEEAARGPDLAMGALELPLGAALSGPSAFLALVVTVVVAAVQTYTAWYLVDDPRRGVFHTTIALFSAAMLLVVLSADLVLTVIGWEVMGWCSYLLIGHWSARPEPRRAAHTAFIVTRIADIGFLLGMAALVAGAGTSGRAGVISHWTSGDLGGGGQAVLATALVLVVIGVLGKSAQLPFHNWLLDAMEGPTPASALIHAATMVAAGTVVLSQLLPLLTEAPAARAVLGVAVAVTMLLAAVCALLEPDLKRMLAWSTISQIGVMLAPLAAAGSGVAVGSALGHLYGHAVFKALLFLAVGWLAATRGSTLGADLIASARQHPVALVAWAAGLVSLAGVPLVLGGLTKEHVIASVADGAGERGPVSELVLVALLATAVVTAAYAARALLVAATGVEGRDRRRAVMPHAVTVVLGVLVVASLLGGLALGRLPETAAVPLPLFAVTLGAVVIGLGIGWALHASGWLGRLLERRPGRLVEAGLGVDTAYRAVLVRPVTALARLVAFLDREVLDSYVRSLAWGALGASALGERAHRRSRPTRALALLGIGLLAVAAVTAAIILGAA